MLFKKFQELIVSLIMPDQPDRVVRRKGSGKAGVNAHDQVIIIKRSEQQKTLISETKEIPIDRGYLLIEDISRKYDLSAKKIRCLCKDKTIECVKKSNRWLVNEESVCRCLAAKVI